MKHVGVFRLNEIQVTQFGIETKSCSSIFISLQLFFVIVSKNLSLIRSEYKQRTNGLTLYTF
jgi:hypothetical protein